jgi:hypothetical protein
VVAGGGVFFGGVRVISVFLAYVFLLYSINFFDTFTVGETPIVSFSIYIKSKRVHKGIYIRGREKIEEGGNTELKTIKKN